MKYTIDNIFIVIFLYMFIFNSLIYTSDNQRTLFDAIRYNNQSLVHKILTENPLLINSQDQAGNTPLHIAVSRGYTDFVNFLLTHNASKLTLNKQNQSVYDLALQLPPLTQKTILKTLNPKIEIPVLSQNKEQRSKTILDLRWQLDNLRSQIAAKNDSSAHVAPTIHTSTFANPLEHENDTRIAQTNQPNQNNSNKKTGICSWLEKFFDIPKSSIKKED